MDINYILTRRNFDKRGSWDLVYEWEDILSKCSGVPLINEKKYLCSRVFSRVPGLFSLQWRDKKLFYYDMYNNLFIERNRNLETTIPCIIDFYASKNEIAKFERNYSKHETVCISSREAYEFLKKNNCQLNIVHLPLTLSDKYRISGEIKYEKKYDLVIVGRPNSVLEKYWERYKASHPNVTYIERVMNASGSYFCNQKGEMVFSNATRDNYFKAMKMSKVMLYSTPGIDGGEEKTRGLSQVTPRFLEAVSSGCHVLSRYKENSDTDFFDLNRITPHISSYEQFESEFDRAIEEDVDMKVYAEYLSKHYTSTIVNQFIKM